MTTSVEIVRPAGLATIAFLKAQIDSGHDHLGMFMPLLQDVIPKITSASFTSAEAQDSIFDTHGLRIPQHTLSSLLHRACKQGQLKRDLGRYWKIAESRVPERSVADDKAAFEAEQERLGQYLLEHAHRRNVELKDHGEALNQLIAFVEKEHVGLFLHESLTSNGANQANPQLHGVIAEFVSTVVAEDPALGIVLNRILEGIVLYHAAFQTEVNRGGKIFKDLTVALDGNLVRQAIGYEGESAQRLMRETLDVLKAAGVDCVVFNITVDEIQRILAMYQSKLATQAGRNSLRQVPMTRHFLTQRYSPADVAEMSALLESEIRAIGLKVIRLPKRVPEYTADEKALSKRFADVDRQDESEPRVIHDVDCVAGVLVLRRGVNSLRMDQVKAVFATSARMVVVNSAAWWREDEKGSGIEPVIHIRALANIAWLKRPSLSGDFKLRELVALCAAAMRPAQQTWDRFISHLKDLQANKRLSNDEAVAIVVSRLSDQLLRDVEVNAQDTEDIDAATLDEVVERVRESYKASADAELDQAKTTHAEEKQALEAKLKQATARAELAETTVAETNRKNELRLEGRATKFARAVRWLVVGTVNLLALFAAYEIFVGHHLPAGRVKYFVGAAIAVFLALEVFGVMHHVAQLGNWVEMKSVKYFRARLSGSRKARNTWG